MTALPNVATTESGHTTNDTSTREANKLRIAIVLGCFATFSLLPLLRGSAWFAAEGLALVLTILALLRERTVAPIAAYCVAAPVVNWLLYRWVPWPGPYLLLFVTFVVVVRKVPSLRDAPTGRWLRRGRLGKTEWQIIGAVVSLSSTALFGWFFLLRPDLSDLRHMIPPGFPVWGIVLAAIGFSVTNAAVEEAVWRGFLFESLEPIAGRWIALVLQAASFGIAHIHGFPRGAIGVGLAAIYGLMTGIIRIRAGGMLAPWVAHVFADLTIAFILATLAFR